MLIDIFIYSHTINGYQTDLPTCTRTALNPNAPMFSPLNILEDNHIRWQLSERTPMGVNGSRCSLYMFPIVISLKR